MLCFNSAPTGCAKSLLVDPAFPALRAGATVAVATAVGMTRYSDESARYAGDFPPQELRNVLGKSVRCRPRQLRIAETEKYPHVTYFLNGGETPYPGRTASWSRHPRLRPTTRNSRCRRPELTRRAVEDRLRQVRPDRLNYANPDMVGHTASCRLRSRLSRPSMLVLVGLPRRSGGRRRVARYCRSRRRE